MRHEPKIRFCLPKYPEVVLSSANDKTAARITPNIKHIIYIHTYKRYFTALKRYKFKSVYRNSVIDNVKRPNR